MPFHVFSIDQYNLVASKKTQCYFLIDNLSKHAQWKLSLYKLCADLPNLDYPLINLSKALALSVHNQQIEFICLSWSFDFCGINYLRRLEKTHNLYLATNYLVTELIPRTQRKLIFKEKLVVWDFDMTIYPDNSHHRFFSFVMPRFSNRIMSSRYLYHLLMPILSFLIYIKWIAMTTFSRHAAEKIRAALVKPLTNPLYEQFRQVLDLNQDRIHIIVTACPSFVFSLFPSSMLSNIVSFCTPSWMGLPLHSLCQNKVNLVYKSLEDSMFSIEEVYSDDPLDMNPGSKFNHIKSH